MNTEVLRNPTAERTNAASLGESTDGARKALWIKLGLVLGALAALSVTAVWVTLIGWLILRLPSWLF
jgi:hypothetical protein